MIRISIVLLSVLMSEAIHTFLTPETLRVVAAIQNQKAKAAAAAVRALAQYNMAKAKTNLGLHERRIPRNSEGFNHDVGHPQSDFIPMTEERFENIFPPQRLDDSGNRFFPFNPIPNIQAKDPNRLEQIIGSDFNPEIPGPELDCGRDFGETMNMGNQDDVSHSGGENGHPVLRCHSPFDTTMEDPITSRNEKSSESNLKMQTPNFQQSFPYHPQFGSPIFLPMPMPQGVTSMPVIAQAGSFQNFPVQQLVPASPDFGGQMILVRSSPENDANSKTSELSSTKQDTDHSRSVNPHHLHGHVHSHAHIYSAGIPQSHVIQIPTTQIVTPGLNLHVSQNQNQHVLVQPGYNQGGREINPTHDVHGLVHPGSTGHMNACDTCFGASQSQSMATSGPTHVSVSGGNFAQSQSQSMVQGTSSGQSQNNNAPIDNEATLSTFMDDPRMRASQSFDSFDPMKPENRQPIVNYIERHQDIEKMLRSRDRNERFLHNFGVPMDSGRELQLESMPGLRTTETQDKMNWPLNIPSIPNFPDDFIHLNPIERQEFIRSHMEKEQKEIKNFFKELEEANKRNIEALQVVNTNPPVVPPQRESRTTGDQNEVGVFNEVVEEIPRENIFKSTNDNVEPDYSELEDMLSETLDDSLESQETKTFESENDFNLGHVIDIPARRESEWFERFSRSPSTTNLDKLNKLLESEKEIVNALKKDATHDEDLMMIGHIGENIIKDLEKRENGTKRTKRDIGLRPYNSPLDRIFFDPETRLNLPNTLDNMGTAVKNALEHEKAPLYHVRNLIGSAQDTAMASIKIPPKNLLIPSQYDIIRRGDRGSLLGDMNPNLFAVDSVSHRNFVDEMAADTFQKMGSAIRSGVQSGQQAINHVGQIANHAKSIIHTSKFATPRLHMEQIPSPTGHPMRKSILITPKILDVTNEDTRSVLGDSPGDFLRMGQLLDAVGVSNPNSNNVHFQRITVEPEDRVSVYNPATKSPSDRLKSILSRLKVEELDDVEDKNDNMLGDTLGSLKDMKETIGAQSLKDFFSRVKSDLKDIFNSTLYHTDQNKENEATNKQNIEIVDTHSIKQDTPDNNFAKKENEVHLMQPFMNDMTQAETNHFWNKANEHEDSHSKTDTELGKILGTMNPMMFEKIFKESRKTQSGSDSPFSVFHHHHNGRSHGAHDTDYDEQVGTNMLLTGPMLSPFMGQPTSEAKHHFLDKYLPSSTESEESNENILENSYQGKELNYEE